MLMTMLMTQCFKTVLGIKSKEQWWKHLQWVEPTRLWYIFKSSDFCLVLKIVSLQVRTEDLTNKHHSSQFIWIYPLLRKGASLSDQWKVPNELRMPMQDETLWPWPALWASAEQQGAFQVHSGQTLQWPIPFVSCLHPVTCRVYLFLKDIFDFFPHSCHALRANFNSFFLISHVSN